MQVSIQNLRREAFEVRVLIAGDVDDLAVFEIGTPFELKSGRRIFKGYRCAIFNSATQSLGGDVNVSSFTMTAP
jgi:hypothetical protein